MHAVQCQPTDWHCTHDVARLSYFYTSDQLPNTTHCMDVVLKHYEKEAYISELGLGGRTRRTRPLMGRPWPPYTSTLSCNGLIANAYVRDRVCYFVCVIFTA